MPLATALIVAACAYQAQKAGSNAGGPEEEGESPPDITPDFLENKTSIDLLPVEQSLTMLEWPISTVSFYQCSSTSNMNTILEKLERRVQSILRANPWLGGWLVRGKGIGSFDTTPRLWYNPTGGEIAPTIFQHKSHENVPLNKNTPYSEYETICGKSGATVKTNPEIINRKGEPLFRVTVIPASSLENYNELALIVSMSHICGDAHTFYRIHHMILGSDAQIVVPLKPQRELLYSKKVEQLVGKEEAHYISHITTDPGWMKFFQFGDGEASTMVEKEEDELRGRVFVLNRHWIGNIKAAYMTEGNMSDICTSTLRSPMTLASLKELGSSSAQNSTQSTNDILVSFFWNLVKPDVGLMSVNFRGRLEDATLITEDHAGNYATPIPYTKEDYKSPSLIRKSLETCRRAGTSLSWNSAPTVLPQASPSLTFSIISNWSSFRCGRREETNEKEVDDDIHGLQLIRHLPIICSNRMIEKMPKRMTVLVIFSSGPNDVGCVLIAPGRVMEEIDTCGVVKEMIAEF